MESIIRASEEDSAVCGVVGRDCFEVLVATVGGNGGDDDGSMVAARRSRYG
jgi:hypothetical protein